jgi:AraC-like DNA-binding protein
VVRGKGSLRLGGRVRDLHAGTVFAYGPGEPLDIASSADEPLAKYFVCFLGLQAGGLLDACGLCADGTLAVFPAQAPAPLFEETIQCGLSGGRFGVDLCTNLLRCLMLKIRASSAPADSRQTAAFATYRRCRRHIERHFLRLQTLADIAGECRISTAYLCRLFRRYEHVSPYQFLLRLKMHYAAETLAQKDMLVKQAAEMVGFADTLHFSRVFHRVLGIPPSDFKGIH